VRSLRLISLLALLAVFPLLSRAQLPLPRLWEGEDSLGMYSITLEFSKDTLSGMLLLKPVNDTTLRMILTAEMGPKLLDMEIYPSGYHKVYAFPKLDRKRILNTFYEDFGALSGIRVKNRSVQISADTLPVTYACAERRKMSVLYFSDTPDGRITSGRTLKKGQTLTVFYYFYPSGDETPLRMTLEHSRFPMAIRLTQTER
jgi:hypothetical protein